MAEEKGVFKLYKRGQGAWARILLAVVLGLFLLWMLGSINENITKTWQLMSKEMVVLSSHNSTRDLTADDVKGLPANVLTLTASIKPEKDKALDPTVMKREDLLTEIAAGRQYVLVRDVRATRILNRQDLDLIKRYKQPQETIPVHEATGSGVTYPQIQELERLISDGKGQYELASDVAVPTWWYRVVFTIPGIEVDLTWGHVVMVSAFVLGGILIFRLANRRRGSDFLIETENELRRVDWSTKAEVFASTKIVVVLVIFMMAMLFVYDLIYAQIFKWVYNIFFGAL
jgi:preprotein translocase SecE subunit